MTDLGIIWLVDGPMYVDLNAGDGLDFRRAVEKIDPTALVDVVTPQSKCTVSVAFALGYLAEQTMDR